MHIETDKYLITTDGRQFIVKKKLHSNLKDRSRIEKFGIDRKDGNRYYTSLPSLFDGLVKLELSGDDDIKSFEQILKVIERTKQTLEKVIVEFNGKKRRSVK